MVRMQRALVLATCVALFVGACRKGGSPEAGTSSDASAVVARVGGRPITTSYYEQRLAKMERRFLPDTLDLAGKRKFLDFIVNKELMALKAEEMKYADDPRVTSTMKLYSDNLAANAAIDLLTKDKLTVSDAEIDEFFEKKKRRVSVKHILVRTQREADELAKKVTAANFDSMANIYSVVPRQDANTGEELPMLQRVVFGEVTFGDAIIPVEESVFTTPLNQVSKPVETGYGWHLFMPVLEKQVSLAPLDAEGRRRVETQVQMPKKRLIVEAYYQDIAKSHGLKMDEDALIFVYDKFPPDADPQDAPDPKTEVKPVIPFTNEERARTLLEVDGRKVTVAEFSDKYDATSWFERPKRNTGVLGLKYWIRDRWYRPLQLERARKDGVYESSLVADELKVRREQIMVSMLHENLVGSQAPEPTPEQLRTFYDEHTAFYIEREKRAVNIIYHAQERVVRRAYDEVKGGEAFVDVAVRYNDNATTADDVQSLPFTRDAGDFAEIAPATFALAKVGDSTEPFKTTNTWVILQLASIQPERQLTYDEVESAITQDWKNQWQEDKLNDLLADWKKNVKIEVNEKALEATAVNREDVVVPGRGTATGAQP